jgi:hypothetical protein
MEEDVVGMTYSTHGKDEKYITKIWSQNLSGRDQSEDLCVDGKLISQCILRK